MITNENEKITFEFSEEIPDTVVHVGCLTDILFLQPAIVLPHFVVVAMKFNRVHCFLRKAYKNGRCLASNCSMIPCSLLKSSKCAFVM